MFRRMRKPENHRSEYATCNDFKQIFTEDMAGLHLLVFLLTSVQDKAEQCFVAGLDDSIKGNRVFRQWARSWSKRAIIKPAIRMIRPASTDPRLVISDGLTLAQMNAMLISSVTALAPFQRFVFAMAVLEGYSTTECALLLGCTVKEVVAARVEASREVSLRRNGHFLEPSRPITWREFLPADNAA